MPLPTPDALTALRRERDRSLAALISAGRRARELEELLRDASRFAGDPADDTPGRIREELDAVRARVAGEQERHRGLSDAASAGLHEWLRQTPEQLVERLSDRDPFLLFPVRLETRFHRTAAGAAELLVRIWPDDIGVAIPPGDLSDAERHAGEEYWKARALAAATPAASPLPEAARRAYVGAWTDIATRYGAYRAGWIVRETGPSNWDDKTKAPALPLVFDVREPSTEPGIARAQVMPDRFVITGRFGDRVFPDVVGAPVPDDLALGPDPAQAVPLVERDEHGRLVVAEPLRWMVDFDVAVSVGMGIRVPLPPPWDSTGFDFLMAIGVRGATGPAEGVSRVEALLATHRFDTGCGIVRNGTPTNNTDSAVSGWHPPSTELEQLFAIEDEPPVVGPVPGPLGETDGWRLVRLLGLSADFVRRLPNAVATDISESLAMNRAASFATVFEFVKECLNPLVSARTRRALRAFFHEHVSGRGVLPAIRIGRQPYGIVVTSDWDRWPVTAPMEGPAPIEQQLVRLMKQHRPAFQGFALQSVGAGKDGPKPFDRFLRIVGQLASSAQYVSRVAVTEQHVKEQLAFAGAAKAAQQAWQDELIAQRRPALNTILPAQVQTQSLLSSLLFTERTEPWIAPIVDRDPKVPLSESLAVAPFDGVRNYLQWLSGVSLADLQSERFIGADGAVVAPPTALLYVLLRYSLLTAVEEGALGVSRQAGEALFDVIERDPLIANIGRSQHVLRQDYLAIDAARLELTRVGTPLSTWVHESVRTATIDPRFVETVAVITDANDSIAALAGVPTARLERLLAEHLDVCSYRLDAWITALYSQRLEEMRRAQQQPGLYLGAYGWVEHLHPAGARTPIAADALPLSLRQAVRGPVFQSADNGGFVHAPSLAQACTAAVLRNAYLSHATPAEPDLFSVNLSSARVRVAQMLIEGVRNGQSMAALLGYELERGLHERHPDEELDVYRYVLRDRFPFLGGKLTELQAGVNADVVEARNVVNGLDLLEHTADRDYPYEIAGLPDAGTTEAGDIIIEIDRLRDALDAVSDLLLAESVHQAVAGNLERTKASLQALTEPEAAPDPEVVRTPRPGRLLTFRLSLALDAAAATTWPGPLTPRAAANPALNAWLARHLPAPSAIRWSVTNGAALPRLASVADLAVQPIDLVLLTGDALGQLSSELERLIARRFRADHDVPDDVRTRVAPVTGPPDGIPPLVLDFAAGAPGSPSLATVHPLLVRLRRLISRGRATDALDWLRSTEIDRVDAADPRLVDLKELDDRLDVGVTALTKVKASLDAALVAPVPLANWTDAAMTALFEAHGYGIPEALPADGDSLTQARVDTLVEQLHVVLTLVVKRLEAAAALRTPNVEPLPATSPELTVETARRMTVALERASGAARELFGGAFVILPVFRFHQPAQATELQLCASGPAIADPFQVEEWLHSAARVRPLVADTTWAMAVAAWMGVRIADPLVLQLPRQPGTPWIGGELNPPLPEGEWLTIVALSSAPGFSGPQCGLVLDEWTERVPADKSTTGVAFHINRPNATAPQALLLAVPPVVAGRWQWDALKGSVREAFELARLRAVEPDALTGAGGYFQGLPAILSEFSKSRLAATHLTERSARAAEHVFP